MKNARENLLSLLHRQGYETVPYEFSLCPSLVKRFEKETHSNLDYQTYFKMPWKRLPDLVPDNDDRTRFEVYHTQPKLDVKTEIDEWGVGHRATASSMHMTQMYCPLKMRTAKKK